MLASFKTCVLALARDKALLVWTLAFPIILTCIFMGMFSGFDDIYAMVGSTLGVVHDESFEKAAGLDATLASISDTDSESHIADLVSFETEEEAEDAADAGRIDAYLTVSDDGMPELHVSASSLTEHGNLPTSVLTEVLDTYVRMRSAIEHITALRPDLVQSGAALAAVQAGAVSSVRLTATKTAPQSDVRYY